MGSWFQRLFDKKQPQTLSATVLSRRVDCTWVVVFQTDCGQELSLNVSQDQYRSLREGLRVEITRKGNDLLSFKERQ